MLLVQMLLMLLVLSSLAMGLDLAHEGKNLDHEYMNHNLAYEGITL